MTATVVVNDPDQSYRHRQALMATVRHRSWCRFDSDDECDGTCLSDAVWLELEHHPGERDAAAVMAQVTLEGVSAVFCNLGVIDGADLTPAEAEVIGRALLRYATVARRP